MKTFSEVIGSIIGLILDLAIFAVICWFGCKCFITYNQATTFATMSAKDRAIVFIADNDHYKELERSYEIVASIFGDWN